MGEVLNKVIIDLAALRRNYQALRRRLAPGVEIMAVVKSNAYGHGLERCALTLARAGARVFGVAKVEEGVRLRQAGVAGEIVIMLGVRPADFEALLHHDLSPVVYDPAGLGELAARAAAMNKRVGVHLKIDTGMGRLGVMPDQLGALLAELTRTDRLNLAGVMSHFPLADTAAPAVSLIQCQRFQELIDRFPVLSGRQVVRHMANSAALLRFPETHLDMVRPGITLYGCYPGGGLAATAGLDLLPVMQFSTMVVQLKEVPADYGLSYGHLHVTRRPTRLAVLPVGYDDGYLRGLTGQAMVLIRGRRVPVLGRICMNACVADVSDLPEVQPGDPVILFGRQGGERILVDELADWLGTINYEVLCLVGERNPRLYVDDQPDG